jgi:uncharacterized protein (DUF4415 family)
MGRRGDFPRAGRRAATIELDDDFWAAARTMPPLFPGAHESPAKTSVHLRVDHDVADWFRRQGKGHLTRMNAVLRAYYEAKRKKAG